MEKNLLLLLLPVKTGCNKVEGVDSVDGPIFGWLTRQAYEYVLHLASELLFQMGRVPEWSR